MSWNFRVFQARYKRLTGTPAEYEEDVFTVREVYYNDDGGIVGITANFHGTTATGETKQELQDVLQKMLSETVWPTLTSHDVPGYTLDKGEVIIPKEEIS